MTAKKDLPRRRRQLKKAPQYELRLYVTGITHYSTRAIRNLKTICEQHFQGHYDLEIIDLYQHPEITAQEQIVAAPTLIRKRPLPVRRFIGDLSKSAEITAKLKNG